MKKIFFFLGIIIFFSSCMSSAPANMEGGFPVFAELSIRERWESGHVVAGPQDGTLVVIGVANRLVRREDEIEVARNYAAQKVAMFHGMWGIVETIERVGETIIDDIFNSRIRLGHTVDYAQFIDQLQFDPEHDVLVINEGTLVRFRYTASVALVNFVGTIGTDGRPNWLYSRNLPEVAGYTIVVGISQQQILLRDTIMKSAQATVARIIELMNVTITEDTVETEHGPISLRTSRSEGRVDNFRILEFWIEPGSGNVHALGIAKLVDYR